MAASEFLFKICLIGIPHQSVTKFTRIVATGFSERDDSPTLGVDISTSIITVDEKKVKLILVKTMPQEFFGKLRPSYYRGAAACIIFFTKNDRSSFNIVPDWYKEFRKYQPSFEIPIALVGFTSEGENVTTEEAYAMAEQLDHCSYFDCNLKRKDTVLDILKFLALDFLKRQPKI